MRLRSSKRCQLSCDSSFGRCGVEAMARILHPCFSDCPMASSTSSIARQLDAPATWQNGTTGAAIQAPFLRLRPYTRHRPGRLRPVPRAGPAEGGVPRGRDLVGRSVAGGSRTGCKVGDARGPELEVAITGFGGAGRARCLQGLGRAHAPSCGPHMRDSCPPSNRRSDTRARTI